MRVLLAARDPAKGEPAAREGLAVEAVSLDVTEAASIRALHPRLATVDVLVNVLPAERGNVGALAGVSFERDDHKVDIPGIEQETRESALELTFSRIAEQLKRSGRVPRRRVVLR